MSMREEQIFARVLKSKKKTEGNHVFSEATKQNLLCYLWEMIITTAKSFPCIGAYSSLKNESVTPVCGYLCV